MGGVGEGFQLPDQGGEQAVLALVPDIVFQQLWSQRKENGETIRSM